MHQAQSDEKTRCKPVEYFYGRQVCAGRQYKEYFNNIQKKKIKIHKPIMILIISLSMSTTKGICCALDPAYRSTRCTTQEKRKEGEQICKQTCESKEQKRSYIDADNEIRKLSSCMNGLNNRISQLCESSASIQYMVEELVDSSNTIEKLLINMTPGLSDEPEMEGDEALVLLNETATRESNTNDSVSLSKELTREIRKTTPTEMESFIAMAAESCRVQAATKTKDSFSDIPKSYRISYATLRELKAGSKNAAVFAGNIIKKLFPELFGPSGLRFKYSFFGGGKYKKNELDRQRKSYMRRYITAMYPEISSEGDWKDIVNRVNEILRRPAQSLPRNAKSSAEKDNE